MAIPLVLCPAMSRSVVPGIDRAAGAHYPDLFEESEKSASKSQEHLKDPGVFLPVNVRICHSTLHSPSDESNLGARIWPCFEKTTVLERDKRGRTDRKQDRRLERRRSIIQPSG